MGCLAKPAEERPSSAAALIASLQQCDDDGAWTPENADAWWARTGRSLRDLQGGNESVTLQDQPHTITIAAS